MAREIAIAPNLGHWKGKSLAARQIESALNRRDWKGARRVIGAALGREPDCHWLLTRLGLTYYEEYDYERALEIGNRAYGLAPKCPLVLWDLAGACDMLGRHHRAMAIYHHLIRRGVESIAFGVCGEGIAWARGLVADCWYRLAGIHSYRARRSSAIRCYRRHLAMRGPGCRSIYPLGEVRRELGDYGLPSTIPAGR